MVVLSTSSHKQNDPNEIIIEDESLDNDGVEAKTRSQLNPDEILLEDEEEDVMAPPPPPPPPSETKFLALDKCLPNRQFLEVIDIDTLEPHPLDEGGSGYVPPVLNFDLEWLAITRAFHPWLSTTRAQRQFPEEEKLGGW
ncbi:lariat debranching enzyme, C-terminal domain-containing protein [Infundibulicybe gibba]|nr:lariat debranching enzyme, C-terminal domain-containing protein [Infundibulicybe gibba]